MQPADPQPANELERHLLAAQQGELSAEAFFEHLLRARLFMPIHDDSAAGPSDRAQPLSVRDDEGIQVLLLFTSPERARPFVADYPEYAQGGLLSELSWILDQAGAGVGISINPGHAVGLDLAPELVDRLHPVSE